jgi:hypothetical protein
MHDQRIRGWNLIEPGDVGIDSGTPHAKLSAIDPPVPGRRGNRGRWEIVLTCDYNGWNDAPEEEREWFDEHPEVWAGFTRDPDVRPLRATPRMPVRKFRGGMAA